MAKKQTVALDTNAEVVEDLHVSPDGVEYEDVTGKDDLPPGVSDPADDDDEPAKPAAAAKSKPKAAADDEVPEPLRGKTPAQLAKMYQEAQQVIGRQGTELGDLRRTADEYIKAALKKATPAAPAAPVSEPKKPDAVDFFTNPVENIARAVANHPAVKALEGANKEFATRELVRQRTQAYEKFNQLHPDAEQVMADPEFRAWIEKSPTRHAMLVHADRDFNIALGNELFSTWKELKAARTPAPPADTKTPAKPGKPVAGKEAARVPSGGNASPRASGGGKEGKIFRRADVIRLMETDPARYELMAAEITQAYQDGRVR